MIFFCSLLIMAKQFRICVGESCHSRMPSLEYDGHSKCETCIGKICNLESRCSECLDWPDDRIKAFLKHKIELEKSRKRKARRRQLLKEQAKLPAGSSVVSPKSAVCASAHSMSSSSSALSIAVTHDSLDLSSNISLDSSVSSSAAAISNPVRDQVITRGELDQVLNKLSALTDFVVSSLGKQNLEQVPSVANPSPVCQDLHSTSADGNEGEPKVTQPLSSWIERGSGPSGNSAHVESCPNAGPDNSDRSRKRSRDCKDSSGRIKRSRAPSRQREQTFEHTVDETLDVTDRSLPSPGPGPRPAETPVPRVSQLPVGAVGSFNDSMSNALVSLVQNAMHVNPNTSLEEAYSLAANHLRSNDPQFDSYSSSRSVSGAKRRRESIPSDSSPLTKLDSRVVEGSQALQDQSSALAQAPVGHVGPLEPSKTSGSGRVTQSVAVSNSALGIDSALSVIASEPAVIDSGPVVIDSSGSFRPANFEVSASSTPKGVRELLKSCFSDSEDEHRPKSFAGYNVKSDEKVDVHSLKSVFPKPQEFSSVKNYSSFVKPSSLAPWRSSLSPLSEVKAPIADKAQGFFGSVSGSSRKVITPVSLAPSQHAPHSGPVPSPRKGCKTSFQLVGSLCSPRVRSSQDRYCYSPGSHSSLPSPSSFEIRPDPVCSVSKPQRLSAALSSTQVVLFEQHVDSLPFSGPNPSQAEGSGPPFPSTVSPEVPNPSQGLATQGQSLPLPSQSLVFKDEPPRKKVKTSKALPEDEEGAESEDGSDPSDSEEDVQDELWSNSKAFAALKKKIVSKYPVIEPTDLVDERSPYQLAHEAERPKVSSFRLSSSVKGRLAALDLELKKRRSAGGQTILKPFLKQKEIRFYHTDVVSSTSASESLLASLSGIVSQLRAKNFAKSKASISMTDLEPLFKSAFRLMQILSFSSQAFEVLGDGFKDLMAKLDPNLKPLALEHASFLRCVDKAGRHATGEAVHLFSNLLLKKREHVMSLAFNSVPKATKQGIIFSPLTDCQLLPTSHVQEVVSKYRQQTETTALASVAAVARSQPSSSFFRGASSSSSSSYSSSSNFYKGKKFGTDFKGYSNRGSGLSAKNRDLFRRRDKFVRGKGRRRF